MEAAVRGLVPNGTPVRIRGPGETPFLREGDAVLPQAIVKERFGASWETRAGQLREWIARGEKRAPRERRATSAVESKPESATVVN